MEPRAQPMPNRPQLPFVHLRHIQLRLPSLLPLQHGQQAFYLRCLLYEAPGQKANKAAQDKKAEQRDDDGRHRKDAKRMEQSVRSIIRVAEDLRGLFLDRLYAEIVSGLPDTLNQGRKFIHQS